MANQLDSNITQKVAKVFGPAFQSERVLSMSVNTQLLDSQGLGTPDYGETMKFKRPHMYRAKETADGDISGGTRNSLISGSSVGTVQNVITVDVEYGTVEQALRLNQLEEILRPIATELCTRVETNLYEFMAVQSGLTYGTPGTAITKWSDVAGAGSLLQSIGCPSGEKYYVMNPFAGQNLADAQGGLASGDNSLVNTAWQNAQISRNFGGLRGIMSNGMSSYTSGATADRAGTLAATPTATYAAHKDSMIQTLSLTGLTASTANAVRPGDVIEFTTHNYINMATRKTVIGADGLPVKYRMTVVTGGNTDGTGAVTVTATCAAIDEGATGQYNTIDSALTSGDAFNILGAADTDYQPSLFFHKQAFGLGSVKLPKLYATDTIVTTKDGLSIRISKYSDGDKNSNIMRFDLLPVHACFNPLLAGRGFGNP